MDGLETIELPGRRDLGLGEVLAAWLANALHLDDPAAIERLAERAEQAAARLRKRADALRKM